MLFQSATIPDSPEDFRAGMLDLTSLSLPDESSDHVQGTLCEIQADWLDNKIRYEVCCQKFFDAIAAEVAAVHPGEITQILEPLPDLVFDVAVEKGWVRFEAQPPERPIRFSFVSSQSERNERWIPQRPDWFDRFGIQAPARPSPPVKTAKLGHHDVPEAFAADFRQLFAGSMVRWAGRARFSETSPCAGPPTSLSGQEHNEGLARPLGTELNAPGPSDSTCGGDPKASSAAAMASFCKSGEMWILSFDGKTVHITDMLGLGYIVELLRKPRVPIEAAVLAGTSVEST